MPSRDLVRKPVSTFRDHAIPAGIEAESPVYGSIMHERRLRIRHPTALTQPIANGGGKGQGKARDRSDASLSLPRRGWLRAVARSRVGLSRRCASPHSGARHSASKTRVNALMARVHPPRDRGGISDACGLNSKSLLTVYKPRTIYTPSRPNCEGRLISVVRCWGGERWLDGALEMRRKHPFSGPSRLVPAHTPCATGAEVRARNGVRPEGFDTRSPRQELPPQSQRNPAAVDRSPSARGDLKGQSTGGFAEQA